MVETLPSVAEFHAVQFDAIWIIYSLVMNFFGVDKMSNLHRVTDQAARIGTRSHGETGLMLRCVESNKFLSSTGVGPSRVLIIKVIRSLTESFLLLLLLRYSPGAHFLRYNVLIIKMKLH